MAAINFSAIEDQVQKTGPDYVARALDKHTTLFRWLPMANGPSQAGASVYWLQDEKLTATGFTEGDTFTDTGTESKVEVRLQPGYFRTRFRYSGKLFDALKNGGDLRTGNYIDNQMAQGAQSLAEEIDDAIKGGSHASSDFEGLVTAIDNDNVYGGVDRSVVAEHASAILDNSGTPRALTYTLMVTLSRLIMDTRRGRYNIILASPEKADLIAAFAETADATFDVSRGGQNANRPIVGFGGLVEPEFMDIRCYFKGRPVVAIPGYATDRVDFLYWSAENIELEPHRRLQIAPIERESDEYFHDVTIGLQLVVRNCYKETGAIIDLS